MSDPASEAARSDLARRDLARLSREGEALGGTAMEAATRDLAKPEAEDEIERLGKKIGRGLAFVALPVAIYIFGRTAGWW